MVVAFSRYSRDSSFGVIRRHSRFALLMAGGSMLGSVAGGLLADVISEDVTVPALAAILVASAAKIWRHERPLQRSSPSARG